MLISVDSPARPADAARFALFDLGFRPFYLLAGAYAALAVPLWALQYAGWLPGPALEDLLDEGADRELALAYAS